jgi:hypothetical protein
MLTCPALLDGSKYLTLLGENVYPMTTRFEAGKEDRHVTIASILFLALPQSDRLLLHDGNNHRVHIF